MKFSFLKISKKEDIKESMKVITNSIQMKYLIRQDCSGNVSLYLLNLTNTLVFLEDNQPTCDLVILPY